MRITPTPSMKQAERAVFLFVLAQVALAFWVYFGLLKQAHLV